MASKALGITFIAASRRSLRKCRWRIARSSSARMLFGSIASGSAEKRTRAMPTTRKVALLGGIVTCGRQPESSDPADIRGSRVEAAKILGERSRMQTEKVIWITGGGTGVGKATAMAMAGPSVHIILSGRRQSELDMAVAAVQAVGGSAESKALDVG